MLCPILYPLSLILPNAKARPVQLKMNSHTRPKVAVETFFRQIELFSFWTPLIIQFMESPQFQSWLHQRVAALILRKTDSSCTELRDNRRLFGARRPGEDDQRRVGDRVAGQRIERTKLRNTVSGTRQGDCASEWSQRSNYRWFTSRRDESVSYRAN